MFFPFIALVVSRFLFDLIDFIATLGVSLGLIICCLFCGLWYCSISYLSFSRDDSERTVSWVLNMQFAWTAVLIGWGPRAGLVHVGPRLALSSGSARWFGSSRSSHVIRFSQNDSLRFNHFISIIQIHSSRLIHLISIIFHSIIPHSIIFN